jgi:glycerol-3-phosphate acyltransferase PlsY
MTIVWVAVGYVVGTIPSAWIVARLAHATGRLDVERTESDRDAHVAIAEELGMAWAIPAATADVVKAFAYILVLREVLVVGPTLVAWAGVAVVVGYAFPFYAERYAGRGLAAASGVLLAAVPAAMIVAGLTIVAGRILRHTGLASTIGMASTPFVAASRGAPAPQILMTIAIFLVVMVRRAEGVSRSFETRAERAAAILRRCIFDAGT